MTDKEAAELVVCAQALLDKIDNITTDDFSCGRERPEREALREVLARIADDPQPRPRNTTPNIGERCMCSRCGQDLEWNGDFWWDRGSDKTCGSYRNRTGRFVREDRTKPHVPNWTREDAARLPGLEING